MYFCNDYNDYNNVCDLYLCKYLAQAEDYFRMGRGLGRINFVNTCPGKTWLCPGKTWLCQNMAENFQTYFTIYLLVPGYKI
jgi:hypothetical protein